MKDSGRGIVQKVSLGSYVIIARKEFPVMPCFRAREKIEIGLH